MLRVTLIVLLFSVFFACGDKLDCDTAFDTPFTVEVGEEYCFPDGSTLLITEITSSYCPCNAQCVWQGETVVIGSWTDSESKVIALLIHEILKDQNEAWTSIHGIALTRACEPRVVNLELIINDPSLEPLCDESTSINEALYNDGPKDFIDIKDASITGDCLTISYSASGCSGDSWEVNLYDSGKVAESEPEQRYLRLSMMNPEACLAVFEKERTFDISNLQIENNGTLILHLEDYEESLRYTY